LVLLNNYKIYVGIQKNLMLVAVSSSMRVIAKEKGEKSLEKNK